MFDVLISGKLLKDPKSGVSRNGNSYTTASIRVPVSQQSETEPESVFVSAIAFGEEAKKLARLTSGDAICLNGSARPMQWEKDGKAYNGLSVMVSGVLTNYNLRKRRGSEEGELQRPDSRTQDKFLGRNKAEFDDRLTF